MSSSFGSLGDLFPESEAPCRIRGCKNKVHISGSRAMYNKTAGHGRSDSLMCDECFARFQTLEDKTVPCSKPGCTGTWVWNRYQQLEAYAQGRENQQPRGFCESCRSEMQGKGDIPQPCRIKGCTNTWNWTKRMQMESKDGKAPRRLCDDCFRILSTLQDQELPCRVKGCSGKVSWNRYQQLEWLRAGKKLENPPSWMCSDCHKKYLELKPVEVECRMNGCKNTWTYTPMDQLEVLAKTPEGQEPETPKRMCRDCFNFFNAAKDLEQPCSNRGCENKWIWSRAMQLGAHIHGHNSVPHRMCAECQEQIKKLQPQELPCCEESCKGTWTYSPEEQYKDSLAKRPPAKRHCKACQEFFSTHKSEMLKCERCGNEFKWSTQEQLQTSLGAFQKPRFCAQCNSQELAEMPPPEQVITPAAKKTIKIQIPTGGAWNNSPVIRDWPNGFNRQAIDDMAEADFRVVCIGDDMTTANDDDTSWIEMLQNILNTKVPGRQTAIINAGIPGCTTALACERFERDVKPFAPHLLIFSFAFADTRKVPADVNDESLTAMTTAMNDSLNKFVAMAKELENPPQLLCWLPNPIYPQRDGNHALWHSNLTPDENAIRFYDAGLRNLRNWCQNAGITVVDCKAMFEMVGQKTALNWMRSWCRPNADGARNIANWLADAISNS